MNKNDKIILRIDDKLKLKVASLRSKYNINISSFLRNCLNDKYNILTGE